MKSLCLTVWALLCLSMSLFAQPPVRPDDHFWRKRVVNRISLVEKINQPLVYHESGFYSENNRYTQTNGLVVSLIEGLKNGKYVAYHPDDWQKVLSYEDIVQRIKDFEQSLEGEFDDWGTTTDEEDSRVEEEWGDEWAVDTEEEWADPFEDEIGDDLGTEVVQESEIDFAPFEEVIHMVEDWVFDRNTSSMVYQVDFFEVIWTDLSGMLPEKTLARFRYKDVRDQLDVTRCKNRFNDAAALSMREIFELRMFNSILINVGGQGVQTLQEAQKRRDELIEFEHHLWSY